MSTGFTPILLAHHHRYPAMQLVDVYKLVHQASMGSEHAVGNPQAAQDWLDRELTALGTGPDEPKLDPISADGSILRVHLRPFLAQGGNPHALLEAFIHTAHEFHGSVAVLESCWADVVRLAGAGQLPYSPIAVQVFGGEMAARNYPAIHHSEIFNTAYRPAYRVVARMFC